METLIEQIERGKLWQIPGGVHPETHKTMSTQTPIRRLPLPEKIVLPIKQHIGEAGTLLINKGDKVLKGQALTATNAHWAVPVHAPTSGEIVDITPMPSTHPSALPELSVIIAPDGLDAWCDLFPWPDFHAKSNSEIVERIQQAGISGMGGAGFPAYIKAQPKNKIEVLIINGVECEPFITSDDMLMREHAAELIRGIEVLRKLYQPTKVVIAIEDDKQEAIHAMTNACVEDHNTLVRAIPTKYPSGGEKQLIQILTGKQVPRGGIPADLGMVVHNVGTIFAIYQAIFQGKPLIERVVTLTGDTLTTPSNAWVLLGTEIKFLLAQSGFNPEPYQRVIMGGPMMGFTLPSVRLSAIKTTNCILAPSEQQLAFPNDEQACIRCSACADACPASLLPQQLQWYAKSKEHEKLMEYNLFDCIECGACAFVCPSEIPLVQYYRVAKAEIKQQQEEKVKAERAKERFEARKERLRKEQEERESRHKRAAKQTLQAAEKSESSAKSVAVAAALARAKAKKEHTDDATDGNDMALLRQQRKEQARQYKSDKTAETPTTNDKSAAVAAAIARAKAKKAALETGDTNTLATAANTQSETTENASADPRKAAVAAAIARAKAKKAAKDADVSSVETENVDANESIEAEADPRKAAVAAAIARAKAKKAAKEVDISSSETENVDANGSSEAEADPRKAAVAAAIARAKAKKAAKEADISSSETENVDTNESIEAEADPRKAAAAIARAKAKKAAKEADVSSSEAENVDANESIEAELDPRKAAVAAAIARAKAKKAAKEAQESEARVESKQDEIADTQASHNANEPQSPLELTPEEKRKAAIARAIANAKAKKNQQQGENE